ncbi:hypothetical protein [Flavobacterium longum]|uniref:hypothetical protein n=1 Tax=Flavobacterium longum TaxID=1299340 RepID=UPI0039E9649D
MIHSWHYINAAPLDNYSVWGSTSDPELKVNFQGYIPELAIYKRKLTRLEAWKVKSYFDIKYALTPDTIIISSYGKKYNEIKILWNPDLPVFKNFNNRLIAIGRDDQSGLKQPKSTTTYEEYDKKYEENEYSAYHNDADGARDLTGLHFVPDKDGTSIQRSLTVGFENDKLPSDDNTFLFIGDNAGEIAPAKIDQVNYKGLEAIGRKWLVYNKDNIKLPTKISVSGKLHDEIYDPYDYLKKRYVLLKFKGATDQIESLTLFSYFGRQVSKDKMKYQFYNNKIIWNDIYWDNAADDTMHYFTFGIVPILKLLSLNNTTIRFPLIDRDKPITCKINYKAYDFTYQNPNDIKIDIEFTPGIPPYQILVEKIVPAGKTTIVNLSSKIEDKNDKSFDNTTSDIDETKDDDPKDNGTIKFPKDDRYCQYTTPNLEANQTYVITITDKVGQEIKFTANTKLPAAPRKKRTP